MAAHNERYNDPWVVKQYSEFTGLKRVETYLIDKYFKKSHFIYDIGCGTGRTTLELVKKGFKVMGMDYSISMAKKCHELNPEVAWQVNDVTHIPYKDNSFDISFFSYNGIDSLVPRTSRFTSMLEMARVTKPGGYVIFSSRNLTFRIFNRFASKPVLKALRDNLAELRVQLFRNLPLFMQGYILQHTNLEGEIEVYTVTMAKNIRQFKNVAPGFDLVEVVGIDPDRKSKMYLNFGSHMIYYVWQKATSVENK